MSILLESDYLGVAERTSVRLRCNRTICHLRKEERLFTPPKGVSLREFKPQICHGFVAVVSLVRAGCKVSTEFQPLHSYAPTLILPMFNKMQFL